MPKIINKIIKTLIISDLFLNLGWGLISPVFAIFILGNISNGGPLQAAEIAGLAALFYWIPRALFEIPVGIYLDKNHGEKDDFWFMFVGLLIVSLVPIGYLLSYMPWHIYILQTIYAAGMAMAMPSWLAIFTRHIDKGKEAFEWGVVSASIGVGAGIAGGLSGVFVGVFGFKILFLFVSGFTIFAAILYLIIRKKVFSRGESLIILSGKKQILTP